MTKEMVLLQSSGQAVGGRQHGDTSGRPAATALLGCPSGRPRWELPGQGRRHVPTQPQQDLLWLSMWPSRM